MSIPVELRQLAAAARDRGPSAYILTVSDLGAPHVVHAQVVTDGERLIAAVGARTAENARRGRASRCCIRRGIRRTTASSWMRSPRSMSRTRARACCWRRPVPSCTARRLPQIH